MTFTGFTARPQATAIPNVFFTDLLPHLTDAGNLAVVLCAFRALAQKRGYPRYITKSGFSFGTSAGGPAEHKKCQTNSSRPDQARIAKQTHF